MLALPRLQPQVDPSRRLVREVDDRQPARALDEEPGIVLRRERVAVRVEIAGPLGVDVDLAVALHRQQRVDVEDIQFAVPAEGDRARPRAERHRVVQEFAVDLLVRAQRPGEEDLRHARVRLDVVRQDVVDRLVPADLQAAPPRALDERLRRRDHEEEVHGVAEARQQVAAGFRGLRREAVEAESVDQQVRRRLPFRLARHVAVELLVDDPQFLARARAAVFVRGAQRRVVEQLLAPDVRADQREVVPRDADALGEHLLLRAHRALACRGGALGVHDHRPLLRRQQPVALLARRFREPGVDQRADGLAAVVVAREVGRNVRDEFARAAHAAVPSRDGPDGPGERAARGRAQPVLAGWGLRRDAPRCDRGFGALPRSPGPGAGACAPTQEAAQPSRAAAGPALRSCRAQADRSVSRVRSRRRTQCFRATQRRSRPPPASVAAT